MPSALMVFITLYGPVIGVVMLLWAFKRVHTSDKTILAKLKPFGDFLDLEITISNAQLLKSCIIVALTMVASAYAFYDYTSLFPQRLQMEVFFDRDGLAKSLSIFRQEELNSLHMILEGENHRDRYFASVDAEVQKILKVSSFFRVTSGSAHSVGEVSNVIEKVDGIQKYHVASSRGELLHILEVPGFAVQKFYSRFDRLASHYDYIDVNVGQLLFYGGIILRTEYKQMIVQSQMDEGVGFKTSLVAVTRARIFPWPNVSNTVYCARFPGIGLVPVAYAVYR
jgi:hypothetical protein